MEDRNVVEEIILKGFWDYSQFIKYEIVVCKRDRIIGTGDYEDDIDIQCDKYVDCFVARYSSTTFPTHTTESEQFLTLEELITDINKQTNYNVVWEQN